MIPAVVNERGDVRVVDLAEVPGAGWPDPVEVELLAGAVQPKDRQVAHGQVPVPLPDSFVAGTQAVVRRCDDGSLHYCRGPIGVRGGPQAGVYAGRFLADSSWLVALPDGLDVRVAAAGTAPLADALHALHDLAGLAAGETVLVLGSSTGVGAAAVSAALAAGHPVVAATRDATGVAARQGVTVTGYDALADSVRAATGGRGADVVIDTVGGAYTAKGLHSGRRGGRQVLLGYQAGTELGLLARDFLATGVSLVGMNADAVARHRQHELTEEALRLLLSGAHRPHPVVDRPLAEGPDALLGPAPPGRTLLLGPAYHHQGD